MSQDRNSNTVIDLAGVRLFAVFPLAALIGVVMLTAGMPLALAQSTSLGELDAKEGEAWVNQIPLPDLPLPEVLPNGESLSSAAFKPRLSDEEVEAMGDRAIERLEASIVNGYVRIPGTSAQPKGSAVTFSPIAMIALDCDVNGPRLHSPFNDRHLKLTEEWHPLNKGPFFIYATDRQKAGVCEGVFAKLTRITAG